MDLSLIRFSRKLLCLLTFGVALTACSGSGSSSGSAGAPASSIPPPPGPPFSTVSGQVVDGFIQNATVAAYTINPDGTVGRLIAGPVATDATGSYFLNTIGGYPGPLYLISSGGSYTDWASGNSISLGAGDLLTALIPAVSGNVTANITPLTHFAAAYAVTLIGAGSLSGDAITSANSLIGSYFSIPDILATPVVDPSSPLSASAPQSSRDYAVILAGFSEYALTRSLSPFDLLTALSHDVAADGVFNGLGNGGAELFVPETNGGPVPLTATAATTGLAAAILAFQSTAAANVSIDPAIPALLSLSDGTVAYPNNFNGNWGGSWTGTFPSQNNSIGSFTVILNQSGTALGGTLTVNSTLGTTCIESGNIAGEVNGSHLAFSLITPAGTDVELFTGALAGGQVSGSYQSPESSACADSGTWSMAVSGN